LAVESEQFKVVLGDRVPPPPPKKKPPNPRPPREKRLKRGELPPRPIIWAPMPVNPLLAQQHLEEQQSALDFGVKNLSHQNRGVLTQIGVLPVVIEEVIYFPRLDLRLFSVVEAAINQFNMGNYFLALENFQVAKSTWEKEHGF